jgi:hypothetical protein
MAADAATPKRGWGGKVSLKASAAVFTDIIIRKFIFVKV